MNMQHKLHSSSSITILKTICIVGGLIALLLIYGFIRYKNQGIDLLQDPSWSQFPGAKVTQSGIHFQPLHRVIVHQDGSVGQPNPPVNVIGHSLLVKGDFGITAVVSQVDSQASFRLYTSVPLVYDQWRYEPASIDINIDQENNIITARIWDGNSDTSMDIRTYGVFLSPKTTISLEHIKNQITIIEDGHTLGSMPDHDIFDSGTIWFGTDGLAGSNGWTLAALHAYSIKQGNVSIISHPSLMVSHSDNNSLANLASANTKKVKIGAAVNADILFTDSQYRDLALGQFSMLTPENVIKPEFIHPEPKVYDFAQADQLVDVALKNNIMVHGHVLVYAKSNPDWMTKSKVADRQQIMVEHIKNVVSHFKGKVAEWDVVNEAFSSKNALYKNGGTGLDQNIWFEAMGEKYIDLAFKTAHEADPNAKLYLNDFGSERDGQHWDALLALVKRLKQRQVPIDGVGFETHIYGDGDYINPDQFKNHMKILANLGLLTRISEVDVTQDDEKEQINQYVTALDVCLRASNCTSYTTWGISDLYGSTTRSNRYPLVYGTSLLWDKDMKAKPTYQVLQKKLQQGF